jgi:glycosyltransferase involved in cell wall biosynthesis
MNPLRAAIISGCVVPRDAVSNIARQQADALGRPARVGGTRAAVRVFCHGSPLIDSRLSIVSDAAQLAADPFFRAADVIVFHFAIRYPAFDAIHLAPRTARVLAYYHGITPPSVCGAADRAITAESYRQANHLLAADAVLTTSRHLAAELLGYGIPAERITVVPPAVSFAPAPRPPHVGPLGFLYVGRFVRPKGVADLLEAFRRFVPGHPGTTLDLAGSSIFSDAEYLTELRAAADSPGLRGRVTIRLDLPADRLAERFAAADVFVLPSYHEGFGVPIVEALAAGCYVVCSDAGASPETAGGLGLVFRAGDVGDLCGCLERVAAAWAAGERPTADGPLAPGDWDRRAADYAATFGREASEERFRAAVFGGLRPLQAGLREYFTDARDRALGGTPVPASEVDAVYEKYRRLAG